MLKAAYTENLKHVQFHLNDQNPSLVARNITILKIISASNFNPNDEKDMAFLWDFWYNTEWPDVTRKRIKIILNELMSGALPENVSFLKSNYMESLRNVWSTWLVLLSKNKSESQLLMKKVDKER